MVNDKWHSYYLNFQAIQNMSESINDALGSQVFWEFLDDLLFYSTSLKAVVFATEELKMFQYLVFYFMNIGTLYLSADICRQMECLKDWLKICDNSKLVSPEEAQVVFHEVIVKDIGIRGSNKFTITFSFLSKTVFDSMVDI